MKNDKVLQMLGLAARGRKIESGEFSTEKAVKAGKAGLVIVAKDASDEEIIPQHVCILRSAIL